MKLRTLCIRLMDKDSVTNQASLQILLFLMVGGLCALVDLASLATLVEFVGLSITLAFFISVIVSTSLNYLLNVKFVFVSGRHNRRVEAFYFFLNSILALAMNYLIMWIFIDVFGVWYIISRAIALSTVSAINFLLRKYLIFQK